MKKPTPATAQTLTWNQLKDGRSAIKLTKKTRNNRRTKTWRYRSLRAQLSGARRVHGVRPCEAGQELSLHWTICPFHQSFRMRRPWRGGDDGRVAGWIYRGKGGDGELRILTQEHLYRHNRRASRGGGLEERRVQDPSDLGQPAPQPVPCTLVHRQPIRSRPARNARTFLVSNSQILLLTRGPESFWQRDGPPQPSPVPLYAALRPCSSPPYFRAQKK